MKRSLLFVALIGVAVTGCDKVKQLAEINKDFTYTYTADVPPLPGVPVGSDTIPTGGISADLPTFAVATNSTDYVKQAGSGAELVQKVSLKAFAAKMKEPANANFNFMDTIKVYLSAKGLSEQLIAYKYGIPKGQSKLDLTCNSDINLKEYFLKDTMYFRVGAHFVGIPDSTSKIDLTSTVNMIANPLK